MGTKTTAGESNALLHGEGTVQEQFIVHFKLAIMK